MRRVRGFQVVTLEEGQWNVRNPKGQWQLMPQMVHPSIPIETSWHRSWNTAVVAFSEVLRTSGTKDVALVSAKKLFVLAVIGKVALARQFPGMDGEPLWKSTLLRIPNQPLVASSAESQIFINYNQNEFAWVTLAGAEKDVPCVLSFLEQRARKNPDGFYGRLVARSNELRDYFRSG